MIYFENDVQTIGKWCFGATPKTNLKKIIIGRNVTKIEGAFNAGNTFGFDVIIDSDNPNFIAENGIIYNRDKTNIIATYKIFSGTLSIPSTVTTIENDAFYDQGISELNFSGKIKKLQSSAFSSCNRLKKVTIPSSIESISSSCFEQCSNINEVIIDKKSGSVSGSPWGVTKGARVIKWKD